MMAEKASDLAFSKEKKKRAYSIEFQKKLLFVLGQRVISLLPLILRWNQSEDLCALLEEKIKLLRRMHRIWLTVW